VEVMVSPSDICRQVGFHAALGTIGIPVERYVERLIQAETRSIVPLGRGYFPHDSRHFVPGYYHAVPLWDKRHSPR
jgi:hypothetical protein